MSSSNLLKQQLNTINKSFKQLLYPQCCAGCGQILNSEKQFICLQCKNNLPFANAICREDGPVNNILWGRFKFRHISSLFFYEKGSVLQHIMYQIKYKAKKELGVYFGGWLAAEIKDIKPAYKPDAIVPVPLHPKKLKLRGFNQSLLLAQGMAKELKVDIAEEAIERTYANPTQTNKTRIERLENVSQLFRVPNKKSVANKSLLIVDDVLTTGATIEATCLSLLQAGAAEVDIAVLACARKI